MPGYGGLPLESFPTDGITIGSQFAADGCELTQFSCFEAPDTNRRTLRVPSSDQRKRRVSL
jgi:hypothetical protein